MRIAFLTFDSAPLNTGRYSRDGATIESLRSLGHDVQPLVPGNPERTIRQRMRNRLFGGLGFTVRTERDRATLEGLASTLYEGLADRRFDIVFSQSTLLTAHLRTELPVVNWLDAVFDCIVNFYPGHRHMDPFSVRAGHRAEKRALEKSDLTLLTSRWAAGRAIGRYKIPSDRIAVVPRAAYLPEVPPAGEIREHRAGREHDRLRVLLIGNDWERKGSDIAVEALRRLLAKSCKVELTAVGMSVPGKISSEPWIRTISPLSKSIGEEWSRLRALFYEADVFLLPSRADFTPNVISESYAFGLPVVASPVGGIPEMIEHGKTGFLAAREDDPEEYAAYLARLINEPGLLSGMSAAARMKFEKEYALQIVAGRLAGHLESICYDKRNDSSPA